MTSEEVEELKAELADLDPESGISCRKIKIPSGEGTSFEVQGEDDDDWDPVKTITGVVVFTHRLSGYWPNAYGSGADPQDKLPLCSSMDGKTGFCPSTGEVTECENCEWNKYGTALDQSGRQGRGKACKNMRRLYIMMDGDPNLYLLTIPPTSIKAVNDQLTKLVPYTQKVITISLEKAVNVDGTPYSKVVIKKAGVLPPAASQITGELRRQIDAQYESYGVTLDDYAVSSEQGRPVNVYAGEQAPDAGFEEALPHGDGDLPF